MISNGAAAVLSFFIPGLGQLCQGRPGAAMVFFGFFVFFAITVIGIPLALIFWIGAVVDAAQQ